MKPVQLLVKVLGLEALAIGADLRSGRPHKSAAYVVGIDESRQGVPLGSDTVDFEERCSK